MKFGFILNNEILLGITAYICVGKFTFSNKILLGVIKF